MNFRKITLLAAASIAVLSAAHLTDPAVSKTDAAISRTETISPSIKWVGTATAIIQYGDLTIVTDPALDQGGNSYDIGFAVLEKTDGPHLGDTAMPKADLVLLSHEQHADNLDVSGRRYLSTAAMTLTTPQSAQNLGGTVHGLATWESYEVGEATITAVPAQHGPDALVDVVGHVTGFIISSEDGPTIYISGDTIPYEGTKEVVRRYRGKIDYALLNAGAVNAAPPGQPPLYATMRAVDAARLADELQVRHFSLMHADSWKHFTELMPEARITVQGSSNAGQYIDLSDHELKSIPHTN